MKRQNVSVALRATVSFQVRAVRCRGNGGRKTIPFGRFIIAAAASLAASAAVACAILFALSVLIRNDRPTYAGSSIDPMSLAIGAPIVGLPPTGKTLPILSPLREASMADAILAAYRRTLVSTAAQNEGALPIAMTALPKGHDEPAVQPARALSTDAPKHEVYAVASQSSHRFGLSGPITAPTSDNSPPTLAYASESAVADVMAHVDRQLPLPAAKPPVGWSQNGLVPQGKSPKAAANAKVASLGDLPERRSSAFPWPDQSKRVAIYDISAGVVYLPNGEKLEAHSGIGRMRDNPSFVHVRMMGPTPPATYALSMREQVFHGVDAIRLTPVNGTSPLGRDGLLAHTYMLRRPGDSNGCVVFANYERFLKAFRNNEVNVLMVVPQLQERMTGLERSPAQG